MARECKFCKTYSIIQEIKSQSTNEEYTKRFKTKYFAALITRDWDTVNKQYVGRIEHERVALKFCPYCGKKLKG
ncbi:MAG: hypothetical protein J1E81_06215 [Eubacterium sp.]|nr:hypothetical protein [Eubacterium sp.]